jgi:hypothetical protein
MFRGVDFDVLGGLAGLVVRMLESLVGTVHTIFRVRVNRVRNNVMHTEGNLYKLIPSKNP